MKLRTVTITGADNSTDVGQLIVLSQEFPFAEWGILLYQPALSAKSVQKSKYPNAGWLDELERASQGGRMRVSAHVCGKSTTQVLQALTRQANREIFDRIQLNIARLYEQIVDVTGLAAKLVPNKREFVVQIGYDGLKTPAEFEEEIKPQLDLARKLHVKGVGVAAFFDPSLGEGRSPTHWPSVPSDLPCGYGGGLGPNNLCSELTRIEGVVGESTIWVDMETHVRTEDGMHLDFGKVRQCLKIAAGYVSCNEENAEQDNEVDSGNAGEFKHCTCLNVHT